MPWDDGLDWYPTGESVDTGWLDNITQGEGAGTGDYSGVDLGNVDDIISGLQSGGGDYSWLTSLLKATGLTTGNNGAMGALLPLLSLFAGGLGLNNQNNNTKEAAAELKAGAEKANQYATDLIGGARNAFTPYQDAGASAVGQLSGMVGANNLAGKFGPITGPGDLGGKFKGTMTLKQLMGK